MKNWLLGVTLVNGLGFTDQQRHAICSVVYGSYFQGCVDHYRNKGLSDADINNVIRKCQKTGISFAKGIDLCKDMIFEE
jgi:hypothetical protein